MFDITVWKFLSACNLFLCKLDFLGIFTFGFLLDWVKPKRPCIVNCKHNTMHITTYLHTWHVCVYVYINIYFSHSEKLAWKTLTLISEVVDPSFDYNICNIIMYLCLARCIWLARIYNAFRFMYLRTITYVYRYVQYYIGSDTTTTTTTT